MLKGVSQKVIEVVHTDNRYFDKAILFLSPTAQTEDKTILKTRASEYLSQVKFTPPETKSKKIQIQMRDWVKTLIAALVGAAIACGFFLL